MDFERELQPRLERLPFFRAPTDQEIDESHAAYRRGDFAALCDVWCAVADPQRATLTPALQAGYDRAGLLPRAVNAQGFLASLRAALAAGVRFREGLSAPTRASLHRDFPWLERRHEHVPPGWSPPFDFPVEFALWIDVPDLAEMKVRWQLAAGLNEVQQAHMSRDCARRFRIPELERHAERERQMAVSYFGHWAPDVDRETWKQCLYLLDALNAAVFALLCKDKPGFMVGRSILGAVTERAQWKAFVDGLETPPWLMPLAR